MIEGQISITGTPDEVQAMVGAASKVDSRFYRKDKISDSQYVLWYRAAADEAPNSTDLLAAIRKAAGVKEARPPKKADEPVTGEGHA
jgi:hypothetical protein